MSELIKSVVTHLCDFCGGWTVEEDTDPSQLIISEQEIAALQIVLPDGESVRFCTKCLADALSHSLMQYRRYHSLGPLPYDLMETNKDDHLG